MRRFSIALNEYKAASVKVARTLVALNMSQACCIAVGLALTLLTAYSAIVDKVLTVSDFIIFNAYIFQMYYPL